jgi:hypothetical protein
VLDSCDAIVATFSLSFRRFLQGTLGDYPTGNSESEEAVSCYIPDALLLEMTTLCSGAETWSPIEIKMCRHLSATTNLGHDNFFLSFLISCSN